VARSARAPGTAVAIGERQEAVFRTNQHTRRRYGTVEGNEEVAEGGADVGGAGGGVGDHGLQRQHADGPGKGNAVERYGDGESGRQHDESGRQQHEAVIEVECARGAEERKGG
jgi:hypothetical protein